MHEHHIRNMQCAHRQLVTISSMYAYILGFSHQTDERNAVLETRLLEARPVWDPSPQMRILRRMHFQRVRTIMCLTPDFSYAAPSHPHFMQDAGQYLRLLEGCSSSRRRDR